MASGTQERAGRSAALTMQLEARGRRARKGSKGRSAAFWLDPRCQLGMGSEGSGRRCPLARRLARLSAVRRSLSARPAVTWQTGRCWQRTPSCGPRLFAGAAREHVKSL